MMFSGDIALPYVDSISVLKLPEDFKRKIWIGNLEGSLIDDSDSLSTQRVVFNNKGAIKKLLELINYKVLALANNHILDTGSYLQTISFLQSLNISYFGLGEGLENASKELVLQENGQKIVLLNFGWEVIQCEITRGVEIGVNPLKRSHVLRMIRANAEKYPGAKIIPFVHWSYELEAEPQPFERELAKKMIDAGAAGVIGCHPHRIGGFEMYNGKPIVYSLGNWLFKQNYYHNGKLSFPDFCNQQLVFDWDFNNNIFQFHFFYYNKENSSVEYQYTENIDSPTMKKFTPFSGLNNIEYINWYKKNHYHKNKGLPIYYWEDSDFIILIKNKLNKLRDILVNLYTRIR